MHFKSICRKPIYFQSTERDIYLYLQVTQITPKKVKTTPPHHHTRMDVGLVEISLLLVLLMILLLSSSSSLKYLLSIISSSTRSGSSSGGNAAVPPLPPGSFGWPIIGETLIFQRSLKEGRPESFIRERMERYDRRVFKTGMFGSETAVLCGAAGHKFLFANENKLVRLWWPPSVQKLLRASLTAIPHADEAKRVRRILSSTLDPDALTRHVKTMDAFTLHHISSLWLGREEVSVYPTIHLYTFELACRLFMGLQDQQLMLKLSAEFHIFLNGVISIPLNLPGTRFYRAMRATEAIRIQLQALVRQRKSELLKKMTMAAAPPPNSEDDLLSHLLKTSDEEGKFLTEEEIIDNMILLLFAGHDTTSSVITLLIKYLAQLPHVYDRVLREQMEIAKSKAERRRRREVLEWEDIQKMRYSWQVVSEVMRLTPPVIAGYREALVDFVYEGFRIPKGWKLLWSPATASKDPMMFGNAEEFEASRFEGTGPPPFSYVPFGGGPRMCLGKEYARLQILVFLHNIVNKFKWELLIPDEKVVYDPMPTPAKGLPIHLFPHTPSSDAPHEEQDFQETTFPLQR
ncbi:hypothetical protein Dimus_011624 [Dionaea muscipula]